MGQRYPNDEIILTGDSTYGGKSILSYLPTNVHLISDVHPKGALYKRAPIKKVGSKGAPQKKGDRLPGMGQWAEDSAQPWT